MPIHPTAIVDPQAEIDSTADIGPYAVVEGPVRIGARSKLRAHAFVNGWTTIGRDCDIHPFAVIGNLPQDFHYGGQRSYCRIGDRVVIREGATVHRGTQPESATVIGDECLLMAYAHVGHNCILDAGVKVYNMTALSGHVEVGALAIISGYALIHQFVRIGRLAFVAAQTRLGMDVPPFMTAMGESTIVQYNSIGMRRAGYDNDDIGEIRRIHRILYRSGHLYSRAMEQAAREARTRAGRELIAFLQAPSRRGHCVGGKHLRARFHANQTPGHADQAHATTEGSLH